VLQKLITSSYKFSFNILNLERDDKYLEEICLTIYNLPIHNNFFSNECLTKIANVNFPAKAWQHSVFSVCSFDEEMKKKGQNKMLGCLKMCLLNNVGTGIVQSAMKWNYYGKKKDVLS